MNKFRLYITDAFQELFQKVTWPSWKELQSSAIVVLIASLIIALIIFAMDFSFQGILKFIYNMFS